MSSYDSLEDNVEDELFNAIFVSGDYVTLRWMVGNSSYLDQDMMIMCNHKVFINLENIFFWIIYSLMFAS